MLRWPCVFLRHDFAETVSFPSPICFEAKLGPAYSRTRARIDAVCSFRRHATGRIFERVRSIGGDRRNSAPIHMALHDPLEASSHRPLPGPGAVAGIAPGPEAHGERGRQGAYGTVSARARGGCASDWAGSVAAY